MPFLMHLIIDKDVTDWSNDKGAFPSGGDYHQSGDSVGWNSFNQALFAPAAKLA